MNGQFAPHRTAMSPKMTKGGENEMAPTNAPKTPQDPAAEQFQMAVENEVAAAKRVSQKS